MPYRVGELVRVTDGPFTDFEAVVQAVDSNGGQISVVVTVAQRSVPIRTEPWQLSKLN
ncbi:transcription termination/antitermination protein NusG [Phenylobacterium sp.]|jgi:transcriptional antiterminator NusG|uniref:transcription termination/antitermination protein NusG n=1 Tax=Phenylobacterium sp. TaxID=1871053 RepID=UPI00387E9550